MLTLLVLIRISYMQSSSIFYMKNPVIQFARRAPGLAWRCGAQRRSRKIRSAAQPAEIGLFSAIVGKQSQRGLMTQPHVPDRALF